ncbi:MAG TPA: secondary thiamine-phosphate synthase enzyme YjbQ [Candidatus Hydrogenedens sp.]|nr:secondary thiamine-phosphate synthase enzyme YjbQ [Candidatus Hydrogenedens sp.]HOL18691.1 secondary thiamine-phosphate synthase enzyme YjbQ [Candidatus Hydrogenedens sp.]HPP58512.1 secondary thiamine-phosphate synthase enzyme YjbQ [Candidatus Hydrogenedens sp.]
MVYQKIVSISTKTYGEMMDITSRVQRIVQESGMKVGIVHIFNVGSTACIGTIEYEPGLVRDLPEQLSRLFPPGRSYAHEQTWHDGNGHSHLQATVMGAGITVPFHDGNLILGTWQQIFHLECDIKPRSRKVVVTVIGE